MPESQNIEYKSSWHDDYLKWICGFANAQGGKIYIGKNDAGAVVGVEDYKRLMDDIPNKIKNLMGINGGLTARYISEKYFSMICGVQLELNYSQHGWDEFNEDYAYVSGDSLLYFASDRPGGKGGYDIYVSRQAKRQWNRPEPASRLFNSEKDDYAIVGNNFSAAFLSNRDSLKNDDDIYIFRLLPAGAEPSIPTVPVEPIPAPDPVFHYVLFFFDFDRDIFRPEFEEELQQVVSEISEFPENRFEIAGYTDEKGSDAYNDKLSLRRARNIKQMLVDRGIPEDKLEVVGRGKGYPVIPNAKTEEENAQNRRVEINIITE